MVKKTIDMKQFFLLFAFCFTLATQAQQNEVENTIKDFFIGFHAKDTTKIKSVCHDRMALQSIIEGKAGIKLVDEKASEFIKSFASFPKELKFEERILGYSVQVDGAMAHAWTPYEFYVNGKLSHKGVNAFTLFKENNTWKIIHLIDTRRK